VNSRQLNVAFSLDFELLWGLLHRIKSPSDSYLKNIQNVPNVVNRLVDFFESRSAYVLWAFVDALNFNNSQHIYTFLDELKLLDNFTSSSIDIDSMESRFGNELLYAPHLIDRLKQSKFSILGSHSFSHAIYDTNDINTFATSLLDIELSSLYRVQNSLPLNTYVFPRNTYSRDHLFALNNHGFKSYRGVENLPLFSNPRSSSLLNRALRLADSFIPIFEPELITNCNSKLSPLNIPSTYFLRPVRSNPTLSYLSFYRIKKHIDYCFENNMTVHFWWHPHNFGLFLDDNIENLDRIFNYMSCNYELRFEDFSYL